MDLRSLPSFIIMLIDYYFLVFFLTSVATITYLYTEKNQRYIEDVPKNATIAVVALIVLCLIAMFYQNYWIASFALLGGSTYFSIMTGCSLVEAIELDKEEYFQPYADFAILFALDLFFILLVLWTIHY